jgi:hypothetical protein
MGDMSRYVDRGAEGKSFVTRRIAAETILVRDRSNARRHHFLRRDPDAQTGGYFLALGTVCYDGPDAAVLTQTAYNNGAAAISSILPGVFTGDGRLGIAPQWVLVAGVWTLLRGLDGGEVPGRCRRWLL